MRSHGLSSALGRRTVTTTAPAPPKRRLGRRIVVGTTLLAGTVYGGGTALSLASPAARDTFTSVVPFADVLVDAVDPQKQMIEDIRRKQAQRPGPPPRKPKPAMLPPAEVKAPLAGQSQTAADTPAGKSEDVKPSARPTDESKPVATHAKDIAHEAKDAVKGALPADGAARKAADDVAAKASDLTRRAEEALGIALKPAAASVPAPAASTAAPKQAYGEPLPLQFEPPPGYSAPRPVDRLAEKYAQKGAPPVPLPQLAPKLAKAEEPVLGELAKTIDSLGTYLRQRSPDGDKAAVGVLSAAEAELQQLGKRIEDVRQAEQRKLAAELERQARAHTDDLDRREREAIERGDKLEADLRSAFDGERKRLNAEARGKLEAQLEEQRELIDARLREEVVAQGVEMQRRWLRQVQNQVETERSGRLGKLDQLSGSLNELEKVAGENTAYLDDALSVHGLLGALRAAVSRPGRADELATLREQAQKAGANASGPVLATLPHAQAGGSDVAVERADALRQWFTSRVAPRIRRAAMLPDNGGVVAYLFSSLLSPLVLQRDGAAAAVTNEQDVASVLARAEWQLTVRQDIDAGARELNSLKGWPKILVRDWLQAARRHLELEQAMRIVESEATLRALEVL